MKKRKQKILLHIKGMHCRSCEIILRDALKGISGVHEVEINYKKGTAQVVADESPEIKKQIEKIVKDSGYSLGKEDKHFFSRDLEKYVDLGYAAVILLVLYVVLRELGLFNLGVANSANPESLMVVGLIGLTAGFSTCMALVGGLVLALSARHANKHPEATPIQNFRPHLYFNAGRIGGYAILGGVLGAVGEIFQLSQSALGIMTIVVALIMLILGIKLLGIFPWIEKMSFSLPLSLSKKIGIPTHTKEYSHRGAMLMGAATFFLPCGFTQAMQLYAISSGSFLQGAFIMGMFALGTAPGMLGIGGLSSVMKGAFAQRFFKFAGLVVVMLAIFNISNGLNLTGLRSVESANIQTKEKNIAMENVKLVDGVQVVSMKATQKGYSPSSFIIQAGIPVRWEIEVVDQYSCANSLLVSEYNIRKNLKFGKNIIEFTPEKEGRVIFSCSMGMFIGSFTIVENNNSIKTESDANVEKGICDLNQLEEDCED